MSDNTCARPLALLAAMFCLWISGWTPGFSQGTDFTIRGELRSGSPRIYSDYFIELVDVMHRSPASRVDVPPDGAFEIRNVPSGEYTLLVSTIYGDVVHRQLISVNSSSGRFEIRLAEAPVNSPATKKTISLKQLLHPPTKKAFNSFVQAQRFSAAGDFPKAAEALERAVRESPEYAEAHVNLGAQYVRIGRFPEAMAELHRAMEIAGPNPVLLCNLASAQARVGQPAEAIESVRWALRLDSGMVQAHLILGALLANDPRTRAEAIVHLELAADEYESARRILTRLR